MSLQKQLQYNKGLFMYRVLSNEAPGYISNLFYAFFFFFLFSFFLFFNTGVELITCCAALFTGCMLIMSN